MSKVRDISNLSNVIRTDASGNVSFVSGSTTLATINTSGQLSGSSPVLSSSYASTSSYATNFNVSGTITATTLVVQTVTSSVIYSSGSNVFGNNIANTQVITGSVLITGSLSLNSTATNLDGGTGSMRVYINRGQATSSYVSSIIFTVGGTGVANGFSEIGNTGNAGDLYFNTDSIQANYTRRMMIQGSTGYVGINNASPSYILDISGSGGRIKNSGGSADFILDRASTSAGATYQYNTAGTLKWYTGLRGLANDSFYIFNNATSTNALILDSSTSNATFAGIVTAYCPTANNGTGLVVQATTTGAAGSQPGVQWNNSAGSGKFNLYYDVSSNSLNFGNTLGTTFMTVSGSGNVGIGTATPYTKLDLFGGSGAGSVGMMLDGSATPSLQLYSLTNEAGIGTNSYTSKPLTFKYGMTYGVVNSGTEAMRITNGGVVSIGNQSPNSAYALGIKCSTSTIRNGIDIINGYEGTSTAGVVVSCYNSVSGVVTTQILGNGGFANYTGNNTPLSDRRLKKDITPLASVWDKVKGIEIVNYKFKHEDYEEFNTGVIAQQVEEVAPELVNLEGWGTLAEDGTPYKGIWETDIYYYSIRALQEAMAKIETLETENDILKEILQRNNIQ